MHRLPLSTTPRRHHTSALLVAGILGFVACLTACAPRADRQTAALPQVQILGSTFPKGNAEVYWIPIELDNVKYTASFYASDEDNVMTYQDWRRIGKASTKDSQVTVRGLEFEDLSRYSTQVLEIKAEARGYEPSVTIASFSF